MAELIDREKLEEELAEVLGEDFQYLLDDIIRLIGDPPSFDNVPMAFWDGAGQKIREAIEPVLAGVFLQSATGLITDLEMGAEWSVVHEWAITWANNYMFDLISDITDTSRQMLRNAIEKFFRDDLSMSEIRNLLTPIFGPIRAEKIAVTEITRAASEGELTIVNFIELETGMRLVTTWQTAKDEKVCIVCGERDGKVMGIDWQDPPPAHPWCRCWLNHALAEEVKALLIDKIKITEDKTKCIYQYWKRIKKFRSMDMTLTQIQP